MTAAVALAELTFAMTFGPTHVSEASAVASNYAVSLVATR